MLFHYQDIQSLTWNKILYSEQKVVDRTTKRLIPYLKVSVPKPNLFPTPEDFHHH